MQARCLPQKNLELSLSLPSSVWLGFRVRSLAMRVGCLSCFLHSPQTASLSIFFISISLLSYEGSLMFQAFKYPQRMPRGFPCHVKVLNFTVATMPFLIGHYSALGGNRLQRHANTRITDLGPHLKFMKRFQCPLVSLCHDHTTQYQWFISLQRVSEKGFIHTPPTTSQPWSSFWL